MGAYLKKAQIILMSQTSHINCTEASSDLLLLDRIISKDCSALSELYDMHSKYLYTIIYCMLCEEDSAEFTLQEVFVLIWEKAHLYEENLGSPLAWMTQLTRKEALNRMRKNGIKKRASKIDNHKAFDFTNHSITSISGQNHSRTQSQFEISSAFQSLNQNQRDLIEFAYFRGYSQSELAEHFLIPLATVKATMRNAVNMLRSQLNQLA